MVQLWFPGLKFGGAKIVAGALLNVSLLGVSLKIPPWDLTLLPAIEFWKSFLIFDSDWVVKPVADLVNAIPQAVWNLAQGTLDSWAAAFYEKHCTYEEYVRERDAKQKEQ